MSATTSTGERVRARSWKDFVGQYNLQRRLSTHIMAALRDKRKLDHMLLVAPPGSGKTTLAALIAQALGEEFKSVMMPVKFDRFVQMISEWTGGVMLLDEIHRAPTSFQESLLSIEDGYVQLDTGERIPTRHITFICATTEPQKVIKPLWDRLLVKPQWEDYSDEEMSSIVQGMGRRIDIDIPGEVAEGLARATAGTPRIAGTLVVSYRDLLAVGQPPTAQAVLELAGIDCDGLNEQQQCYLRTLRDLGGRSGLKNMSTMLQLSSAMIEDLERMLIKRGFIRLESNGRILTGLGRDKVPDRKPHPSAEEQRAAAA